MLDILGCVFCIAKICYRNKGVAFDEPYPPKDIQVEPDKKDDWEKAGEEESRPVDVIPIRRGDKKFFSITFVF